MYAPTAQTKPQSHALAVKMAYIPCKQEPNPAPSSCLCALSQQQLSRERSLSPDPHTGWIILAFTYRTIFQSTLGDRMVSTTPCQCRLHPEQSQGEALYLAEAAARIDSCLHSFPPSSPPTLALLLRTIAVQGFGIEVLRFP